MYKGNPDLVVRVDVIHNSFLGVALLKNRIEYIYIAPCICVTLK